MAPRKRTILFASALIAAWIGIVYFQYTRFRSPGPTLPPSGAREILSAGPAKDGIPAIDHPTFASVLTSDQYLKDEGFGIDVATAGKRRFYPFQILVWHLVVNDVIDGTPALVTFCPLCQEGGVYRRQLGEATLSFGTAGQVWNNISLLYDKTGETLWTAAGGLALQGPRAGDRLTPIPSRIMNWKEWKVAYPDGSVLARVPNADRDYTLDPYGSYAVNRQIPFPINHQDPRLSVKTPVYGLAVDGANQAYTSEDVARANLIQENVGAVPAVIWRDADTGAVAAFDARAAGKTLTFYLGRDGGLADRETGSAWNTDGIAYAGTLKKTKLTRLPLERTFWFCWAALHPGTNVYKLP